MNFLKGAAIFVLGAAVGATGSYLYFKKKYEERKEELTELQEHYSSKMQKVADVKTAETISENEGYIATTSVVDDLKEQIRRVEKEVIDTANPSEDYPEEPIIITEEDYTQHELYFDKLEMDYYLGDGALVDENDKLVEIEDAIGYDNLEKFINDESEDIVYIRNGRTSADYMIRKVAGSYSEVVGLGGDDDD